MDLWQIADRFKVSIPPRLPEDHIPCWVTPRPLTLAAFVRFV